MVFLAKKIIAIILGIFDVALLAVILFSFITDWHIFKTPEGGSENTPTSSSTEKSTQKIETQPYTQAATQKPTSAPTEKPTQADTQNSTEETSEQATAESSEETTAESTQTSSEKSSEKPTSAATQNSTGADNSSLPDSQTMSTTDYPSLADVKNFKSDSKKGSYKWSLPSSAVKMDEVSSVFGGWKAYMISSDSSSANTKHLFNVDISASQKGTKIVFTWYYVLIGSDNKTQEDNTPSSTFNGSWSEGTITATGSGGKLTLKDFYYDGSKGYAVGDFTWPDGTSAAIALVRP